VVERSSGYSKRPLPEKLGIKEGFTVGVINAPPGYLEMLAKLPKGVRMEPESDQLLDFVHLFTAVRSQLEDEFPKLKKKLTQRGMLWISWPKRSSGVETDLSESVVREIGLGNRLVDVKVASIDETWSGLKFVRRVRDRK
jgi:hypothetical protein